MSNICSGAKIKIEHFKKQYIESSCYDRYLVLTKTSGQNKTSSNHTVGILHSEACILLFLCKNHNRKQQKLHANELMREKGAGDDWEEELYKESEMQLYIPVDTHTAILQSQIGLGRLKFYGEIKFHIKAALSTVFHFKMIFLKFGKGLILSDREPTHDFDHPLQKCKLSFKSSWEG